MLNFFDAYLSVEPTAINGDKKENDTSHPTTSRSKTIEGKEKAYLPPTGEEARGGGKKRKLHGHHPFKEPEKREKKKKAPVSYVSGSLRPANRRKKEQKALLLPSSL